MSDALRPIVNRLAIIGAGLIGSSIARVARQRNLASSIAIADRSPIVRGRVRSLALADAVFESADQAAQDADVVMLCAPVGAFSEIARQIGPRLKHGALVTDVGSVKSAAIAMVSQHLPPFVDFVPAHPVTGTELSGPDAGSAELFEGRWCILTPPDKTKPEAVELIRDFWIRAGSNVEVMSATHHDLVLATTSHLPHLIAYNIVATAADLEFVTQSEIAKFSAGGFRDFTRIAASDPVMWRDIFLNNKEAVLEMLGRFNEDLAALQRMIRWGDGDGLLELFTRTRAIRNGIVEQGQETNSADFVRPRQVKG